MESAPPEPAVWPEPPEPRWPATPRPGWPETVAVRWPVALGVFAALEVLGRFSVRVAAPSGTPARLFGQRGPLIHILGTSTSLSTAGMVAFCVLCLLTTLPSGLPLPAAAGVVVTVASVVSLEVFAVLTVAGLAAQLLVAYRLGRSRSGLLWPGGSQLLALALAVPYLVLALAEPGRGEARVLIVLLAALTPAVALAGVARRREAEVAGAAEQAIAGSLFEHMARGERALIARELHDVVAHHISMVAVQAETARLATPDMPELGARRLLEIGDTARAGLTEMRRLLGVLREDARTASPPDEPRPVARPAARQPQPNLGLLNELLDGAREASGTSIRLIVSGRVARLDPGVELAAYRIVQEALTNSRRHATGAAVDVELHYGLEKLRLRVRDNGPGSFSSAAGGPGGSGPGGGQVVDGSADGDRLGDGSGGHGLLGMRERAQSVGGELRAGPAASGGFLVEAALPVPGQPAEGAA